LKNLCVVRQRSLCFSQFSSRPIVIEVTEIRMNRLRKVRLAGIWLKTDRISNTRLGELQTIYRVIVIKEIYQIVRASELTISKHKRRITRDGLPKQLHGFKEILSLTGRAYFAFVDKFLRPQV